MRRVYSCSFCEHTRSIWSSQPDDFEAERYTLRPAMFNRHTELFVGVTLYNEDEILFTRTMHGIMSAAATRLILRSLLTVSLAENISHLCTREKSRTWGKEGWKKVVVCIVADGRKVIHPRVLDW